MTEKLDDVISTGDYGVKELESIPLINIHFGEAVQTHNEEGDESFHIVQQSSCGINNNLPLSYIINSMEEVGNRLEIVLNKYYSEVPDPNPMYVSSI